MVREKERECTHSQLALPSCPLLSHCQGFCCFLTKFWHWLHILFFCCHSLLLHDLSDLDLNLNREAHLFSPCQSVTNSGQNSQFLHTFSFSHHLLICKFVAAHTECPCVEEDGSLIYSFLGECGLKVHSFSCLVIVHHCTVSPINSIVCVCMCSLCSLWQECSHRLDNMSAITGHWSLLSYCSCPQTHTHCFSLPFTYLFFKVLFLISFLAASILF